MSRSALRWRPSPPVADGLLAGVFAVVAVVERLTPHVDYKAGPLAVDVPMTAVVVGMLALRRAAPLRALLVACAAITLPTLFVRHDFLLWSHLFPLLILLYTVARHRPGRVLAVGVVACTAALAVNLLLDDPDDGPASLPTLVVLVVPVMAGVVLRRNARRRTEIAALLVRLDEERETRQRLAVVRERAAVARDLHDVVAHAVSLMVVQAGLAGRAVTADPAGAERSVLAVEAAGRAATEELRRMLGLLRDEDAALGAPAPDLDALDALLERMRGAGLAIDLEVAGSRPALPPGFEVTAYRIVQEALTNVLRHAGPTRVALALRYGDALAIEVVDAGPAGGGAPEPQTPGHGLVGMRERVALLGGDLRVDRTGPGWAVRASLPMPGAS